MLGGSQAGLIHEEFPAPWAVLEGGESFGQVVGVGGRGGAHQEQSIRAAGGTHGGDRLHWHTAGEVGQPAVRLLFDGCAAIGMVVDDQGLATLGEGSELVEIGVLDRLRAVRGLPVRRWPDAVVGIGEDQSALCASLTVRYQTTPSRSEAGESSGISHRSSPNFR